MQRVMLTKGVILSQPSVPKLNPVIALLCLSIFIIFPPASFPNNTEEAFQQNAYMDKPTISVSDSLGGNYIIYTNNADIHTPESLLVYVDKRKQVNTLISLKSPHHIKCIALSNDQKTLYIGGDFNEILNQTRKNAAAINTATHKLSQWNPAPDGSVYTIVTKGNNTLFTGGAFHKIYGKEASFIAIADLGSGSLIPLSLFPNGKIESITLSKNGYVIYIAGKFTEISGHDRINYAGINLATKKLTDWNPCSTNWLKSQCISATQ